MATARLNTSRPGLSVQGNAGTGSYLVGKAPMGPPPSIKAANYPSWHPKNPGNQVRVTVSGA